MTLDLKIKIILTTLQENITSVARDIFQAKLVKGTCGVKFLISKKKLLYTILSSFGIKSGKKFTIFQ